jgi:tetratricopeptide (TPR) repeat protein
MMNRQWILIGVALVLLASTVSAHPRVETGWGELMAEELKIGDAHFIAEEYARALDAYDRAARLAPHAFMPAYKIALTQYRWADAVPVRREDLWPSALKTVERARFLDPLSADATFLAGVLSYRLGDFKKATEIYRHLERNRQGDPDLYLDLAVAAWRVNDMTLATTALEAARRLAPGLPRLHRVAREIHGVR